MSQPIPKRRNRLASAHLPSWRASVRDTYPVPPLLWGLLLLVVSACGGDRQDTLPAIRTFEQQVRASARAATAYHKVVTDRNQAADQIQDTLYRPAWRLEPEGDSLFFPLEDLRYALDRYHADPFVADRFDLRQAGDTLIAQVRPGLERKSDLQRQKIIREGPAGPFRYIESTIIRASWLYRTEVHIAVFFDTEGRYQRHQLDVKASIPLLGDTFDAGIAGKLLYP